jgi:glycosyltransferase involved in cell wall biosynthesis
VSNPTVSVTVTNYNYGRFLDQNIESILGQSFEDFEVVFVDNASTDNSVQIVRKHEKADHRIRVIAHPENQGRFASLRESCDLSRGRYRVHLDADDYVLSRDAFKEQVTLLDAHPSMAFVYSALTLVNVNGDVIHVSHPYDKNVVLPSAGALEQLLTFNVNHSGLMLRLDSYRATTGYTDKYPQMCDVFLAVRLSEQGDLVGYVDRPLYAFRQHGTNLHLNPDMHIVKKEVLPIITEAFDGPLGSRVPNASAVRRRVVREDLLHFATQYIFSGRPRVGWQLYWESLKLRPYDTVFQRRTLSLLARTLLGQHGFQRLAQPILNRR